jgi:hypothetical protein
MIVCASWAGAHAFDILRGGLRPRLLGSYGRLPERSRKVVARYPSWSAIVAPTQVLSTLKATPIILP